MSRLNRLIRSAATGALALACLVPAAPAAAACSQSDLVGTWQFFFTHHVATPPFWMSCTFEIKPTGAFTADRSTCASRSNVSRKAFGVIQPTAGQSCTYKGYVVVGGIRFELNHATMRRTKDHLNGVGLLRGLSPTIYSATKL
ncbi:MAG TPA: hypothetical protein VNS22_15560 [Geminicoccus sp.]|uniref:hypothetical protein n=1 Tax=Geminicoccus sp. TaxID=2024832 RepID=UPI002C2ED109|nr:hypothetical protein [Geminicoccus sp.]HWL69786.1 hypothetical protein [Geminicoccus sp.]